MNIDFTDAQVHVVLDALAVLREDIESNGSEPWVDYAEIPEGGEGKTYEQVLGSCRELLLARIGGLCDGVEEARA